MKHRKAKTAGRPHAETPTTAKASNEPDEVFQGPGFIMARKGRLIHIEATATEEEHQAMLRGLSESRSELEADIERQVAELGAIINEYDPFDVISNIWLANTIINPDTYREYEHEGKEAYAEYVALLCLTQPYHESQERVVPGPVIEDINSRIEALFRTVIIHLIAKDIPPDGQPLDDTLHELRFNTIGRSLMVRYPGYQHHQGNAVRGICSPLNAQILEIVGFDIEDALAVAHGVGDMLSRRINDRLEQSRGSRHKLFKQVKRYRKKKRGEGSDLPPELLKQLSEMKPSQAKQNLTNLLITWTFFAFGHTLSFTAEEVAHETGRDTNRILACLESMSLEFGEVEPRYRVPAPTHPLTARPFIRYGDHFFCPVLNSILWSVRPNLEGRLNPASHMAASRTNSNIWQQYQRARSDYLESRSMELLNKALRHAESYRNLEYDSTDGGQVLRAELDGMLFLDSTLFIMEAKAGVMSLPARRGALQGIVEDLRELVGKAHEQALRAKRHIESNDKPIFHLSDGTAIEVPKQRIDKVFMVTVTLDALDAFITSLYQLEDLGIFVESDLPWAVSLLDLEVIADLSEFSSQFVHYLLRRYRLNQIKRVYAHDELDWFGYYLQEGLYFEDVFSEEGPSRLGLLSYTTAFDDYYFYALGYRTAPAPKPVQPMPEIMRQILRELDEDHPSGYLDVSGALLDMNSETREQFVRAAEGRRNLTIANGGFHDCSLVFTKPSFGITYMFGLHQNSLELRQRLEVYCQMKKYQTKTSKWYGLGCLADIPGWAHIGIVLKQPWQHDEEMERLVAEALPPLEMDTPQNQPG